MSTFSPLGWNAADGTAQWVDSLAVAVLPAGPAARPRRPPSWRSAHATIDVESPPCFPTSQCCESPSPDSSPNQIAVMLRPSANFASVAICRHGSLPCQLLAPRTSTLPSENPRASHSPYCRRLSPLDVRRSGDNVQDDAPPLSIHTSVRLVRLWQVARHEVKTSSAEPGQAGWSPTVRCPAVVPLAAQASAARLEAEPENWPERAESKQRRRIPACKMRRDGHKSTSLAARDHLNRASVQTGCQPTRSALFSEDL